MIGHWWLYGRKWRSLLQKRKLGPPNTEGPQEIWNIPRPWLQQTKSFSPPTEKLFVVRGSNNNERGPKVMNFRIYNWNLFLFVFAWDLYSLFFIQGVFKSHLKSQFDVSLSYMNVLKNGSVSPPTHHPGEGGVQTMTYIFFVYLCLLRKAI